MNASLEQRMQPEFYAELAKAWREHGLSEEDIASNIAKSIDEMTKLHAGVCPQCGAPCTRSVDYGHQQGGTEMPGAWVSYRCSTQPPIGQMRPPGTCDFMIDLVEGAAAS